MDYHIRKAKSKDNEQIISIFNYYVENSYAAYPENKADLDFLYKLTEPATGYPLYVFDTPEREVVGFGLMRPYHNSETFRRAAKLTLLHPSCPHKKRNWHETRECFHKESTRDWNRHVAC